MKVRLNPIRIALAVFAALVVAACVVRYAYEANVEQPESSNSVPTAELDTAQAEAVEGYDDAKRGLLEILETNSWVSTDGGSHVVFGPDAVRIDNEEAVPFVVETLRRQSNTYVGTAQVGKADAEVFILEMRADGTWLFSHPGFAREFESVPAQIDIDLGEIDTRLEEAFEAYGGTPAVEQELSRWCEAESVVATTASWDGTIEADYRTEKMTVSFKLDDAANTVVKVVTDPGKGTLETRRA